MSQNQKVNRLLSSVLFGLVSINALVLAEPVRPRLVVGIVVDQLRTDYIDYLRGLFGEKGFRRLIKEGAFIRDVDFRGTASDVPSATAVIFTGNYPCATGIPQANVYSPSTRRSLPALHDASAMGNSTDATYSPSALRLSTISDEIAIDGAGLSAVYSVSADPQQAIIMSGHAGKGAVWIDENTGRWASTTFYPDFPSAVARRNQYNPLYRRADTIQWKPSLKLSDYPGLPAQKRYYPFRYTFPTSDRSVWRRFKISAPANAEVTDVAIECLKSLSLGTRGEAIDMLNVGYTAAPYKYVKDGDFRIELEDTYIKLDTQIGRLLDEIDRTVGLGNTLICLSSTGYYDDATPDGEKYRIPTGDFSLKRAESLLNAYLSAKYGNGDYVETICDGQVYLDHKAIESRQLRLEEVRADAREFLLRMSGVYHAYTLGEVASGSVPGTESLRLSVDPKTCGDIFLSVNPGWNIVDDLNYPHQTYPQRMGQYLTPAIIMGPGVKAREIVTPVDAAAIAPTVTSTLHIRSPNGSVARPLSLD